MLRLSSPDKHQKSTISSRSDKNNMNLRRVDVLVGLGNNDYSSIALWSLSRTFEIFSIYVLADR